MHTWTPPKTWDDEPGKVLNLEWWRVLVLVLLAAFLGWAAGRYVGSWAAVVNWLSMLVFGLWVTPKTWTAVVVTVADLNQHIRDNMNVLKTSINDDGTLKLVPHVYAPTLLDVVNSTSKALVASFTMPANEMADKNMLKFWLAIKTKNYISGATQPVIKFEWGSSTVTLPSFSWGNGNVENLNIVEFIVMRVGSDLWVRTFLSGLATPYVPIELGGLYDGGTANVNGQFNTVLAAPTFTSNQTVGVSVQFPTADANIYWKTPAGGAVRYPVA